jgi:hypothetical protein
MTDMSETDTTIEALEEAMEPSPANGYARRQTRKASAPASVLTEYREARERVVARRLALRLELQALDAELGDAAPPVARAARIEKPARKPRDRKSKSAEKRAKAMRNDVVAAWTEGENPAPAESEPVRRGTHEGSLPARIYQYLVDHPESLSGDIAKALEAEVPKVSSALGQLRKRGKVESSGQRPLLHWSAR